MSSEFFEVYWYIYESHQKYYQYHLNHLKDSVEAFMKQSEYPPAELRCGENFVAIEKCVFYCEDAETGIPRDVTLVAGKIRNLSGICLLRM